MKEKKSVGMVLGSFAPLHKGHMELILQAKKENDLCYVIVCGYNGDKGEPLLPLRKRVRYVKETFKNDELVKVISVNDTELGIDESMSKSNWGIWLECVLNQLEKVGDNKLTRTWYVGEPRYVNDLANWNENAILINRQILPISATLIRNNPIKYWNYISPVFRKVYSHNILITGTASEGKTTLTRDIAKLFGLPHSEEMGRVRIETTAKKDNELDFGDFLYNLYEQNNENAKNIDGLSNRGVIISDTDNLVTLMYAKLYAEEPDFELTYEDYLALYTLAKRQSKYIKWNKIFVLAPRGEYVDDGYRYMGHKDMEIREKLFKSLIELLNDFGYEYEILKGGYLNNYLRVKDYVEGVINYE
jgi:NadR type nicotinamide-nucleotide adenylyltransferase